jgi:hypothetical protein
LRPPPPTLLLRLLPPRAQHGPRRSRSAAAGAAARSTPPALFPPLRAPGEVPHLPLFLLEIFPRDLALGWPIWPSPASLAGARRRAPPRAGRSPAGPACMAPGPSDQGGRSRLKEGVYPFGGPPWTGGPGPRARSTADVSSCVIACVSTASCSHQHNQS